VHAWLFCRDNLPALTQEAVARLKTAGVRDPVVEVRFFDIAISGEAPDPKARQQALTAIRTLIPLRLQPGASSLYVVASLKAALDKNTLHLSGWLPEGNEIAIIARMLAELRPDLELKMAEVRTAPEVRWPDGIRPPLSANSVMLKPVMDMLRVPPELRITAKDDSIVLQGLLPSTNLKEELVASLAEIAGSRVVDPSGQPTCAACRVCQAGVAGGFRAGFLQGTAAAFVRHWQ
jgi:hypothetical protein